LPAGTRPPLPEFLSETMENQGVVGVAPDLARLSQEAGRMACERREMLRMSQA
jgi:hypothetical protein